MPVLVLPYVNKSRPDKIYPLMTALIGVEVALIGGMAFMGMSGMLPVLVSVVLITVLACMTIAEAMPMQMCFSIMMQTRVSKELLGRVSSLIKVVSVASVSIGQFLLGLLMDVLPAWLPLLLAGCAIWVSSLIFRVSTRGISCNPE